MLESLKNAILNWLIPGISFEEDVEESDCPECQSEASKQLGCLASNKELIESWVPLKRYCVRAGGVDYWVDNYKFGPGSLDVFWTQKIGGVEKPVSCSIFFETSITIIDYETMMTSEVFDQIRETGIDFKQEVIVLEGATKRIGKRCIPQNTSVASSYA
jgi:hypothetical protein